MGVPGLGARHLEALQICIDEGLRPLEEVVRGNLGTLAYFAGRWTEAAEWYRTAREVAIEVGKDFGAAETGVNLAELLLNQGDITAAEVVLADALRVLRASGAAPFLAQGEIQLARVLMLRGDSPPRRSWRRPIRHAGSWSWTRRRAPSTRRSSRPTR